MSLFWKQLPCNMYKPIGIYLFCKADKKTLQVCSTYLILFALHADSSRNRSLPNIMKYQTNSVAIPFAQ